MSISIPPLRLSKTVMQSQRPQENTNGLQIAGDVLSGVGAIKQEKEKRDAKSWAIKADSDLRFAGLEALDEAKNEAESPDKIGELFFNKLEQRSADIRKNAPNKFASDEYESIYQNVRRGLGQQAISSELQETQALRRNQIEESINKGINFVRNGGSYSDTRQVLDNYFQQADEVLTPNELFEFKKKAQGQLKTSQLDYLFEQGRGDEVRRLINDAEYNKDLQPRQITAYRNALKKAYEEQKEQAAVLNTVEGGPTYLDPKNKKTKKAIDLFYKANIENGLFSENPQERNAAYTDLQNLTLNTGVVPDSVQGFVRSAYVSNDMAKKAQAYQYVDDIASQNPNILELSGITDKQVTEATFYSQLIKDGVPENEAIQIIKSQETLMPEVRKVRQSEFKDKPITSDLEDLFDIEIIGEPDLPLLANQAETIKQDFNRLAEQYYIATGNKEAAKKRAEDVIKGKYSVSRVARDDGFIMENPPEKFFSHPFFINDAEQEDLNPVWMRQQLVDATKEKLNKDIDIDDIFITSDVITNERVKRGQQPTYSVYVKTEDVGLQYLDRFTFDVQKALENRKSELFKKRAEAYKASEKARKKAKSEMMLQDIIEQRFP